MNNRTHLIDTVINKYFSKKYSIYYSPSANDIRNLLDALSGIENEFGDLSRKLIKVESDKNLIQQYLKNKIKSTKTEFRQNNLHYKQKLSATCGIACYLMALSIYDKKIKPSAKSELETYKALKEKNSRHVKIESIMKNAGAKKIKMEIFSEHDYEKTKFDNAFAESLRLEYLKLLDKLENKHLVINHPNTKLTTQILMKCLNSGMIVLINGMAYEQPHMRLVSGYTNKSEFVISDPQEPRKTYLGFKELLKISKPPLGMWAMAVYK